jgi:hypothetical protein
MTIQDVLSQACADLFMPSESDYPFDVFVWQNLSWQDLENHLKTVTSKADAAIETTTIEHLFRNVAVEKEWHDPQQISNVKKFQALIEVLQNNLQNIQVYRVGEIEIDLFIVGEVSDQSALAGIHTVAIET